MAASALFGDYVRKRHSPFHRAACEKLEDDFTLPELTFVLQSLTDVGPGLDGVSPASLQQLQDNAKQTILDHLNTVWRNGITPTSWNEIRIVLHYKGKGSDPYCADNYRGLGIGAIWEKVLSLMMMHRLEQFLTKTDALHGSQGGFLRMRGPPEQVFTLSETVRAELLQSGNSAPVFLTFIDIEKAYDSVVHPKLWARCAEMGIGGRFLATLQSMYAHKRGTVDINGELIGSHDIECGVLQGNPLSPLLFNIYIDKLLRSIDDFARRADSSVGIPLPRHATSSFERLCSLFFADDGVLITRDHESTQQLLNFVDVELSRICLPLNARKTKVMIVPPLDTKPPDYDSLKQAAAARGGFVARSKAVEVVDEFVYLGVLLWWRWDYSRAYEAALLRAKRGLYRLRQAGLRNRHVPLAFQYRIACALVLSHLDYVAPLAGMEGYSKALQANEKLISQMLRMIVGTHPFSSGQALKAESGTWPQVVRIRMLQLRFFIKLCCSPPSSTHLRALRLSWQCALQRNPLARCTSARRTPFFSRVLKSSLHFLPDPSTAVNVAPLSVASLVFVPTSCLAFVERLSVATRQWVRVDPGVDLDQPDQRLRLRCTSARAFAVDYIRSTHVTSWDIPSGTTISDALLNIWSVPLRNACFASLRRRGNLFRQQLFSTTSAAWASSTSHLSGYIPLKRASFMETYWFGFDPISSARLGKARMNQSWGHEAELREYERMAPLLVASAPFNSDGRPHLRRATLPRIEPWERACYNCDVEDWLPETMPHLLLHCQHHSFVQLRADVLRHLRDLSARVARLVPTAPPAPDFSDEIAFYCVLQLCTSVGSTQHLHPQQQPQQRHNTATVSSNSAYQLNVLRPMGVSTRQSSSARSRDQLDQRRRERFLLDPDRMRPAVAWVAFLCNAWRAYVGNDRAVSDAATAGGELTHLICRFHQSLFAARRRNLSNNIHFLSRDRDPPRRPPSTAVSASSTVAPSFIVPPEA